MQTKEQIKNYAYNDNSVLTQLNQELQELNSDFSTEIEKQVVQNIENNFHGLRKRFEEAESLGINFNDEIEKAPSAIRVVPSLILTAPFIFGMSAARTYVFTYIMLFSQLFLFL